MAPFWKRLTQPIPHTSGREVIWIHGVSVGEIKAAQLLYRALKNADPNRFFLITTTTETGQAEAMRSLPDADAYRYLPIDFPWLVRRWTRLLRPKLFFLIESDFWPNLLSAVKAHGGKNILVSGKLSEKSAHRFLTFSFFAKRLFDRFDLLCVQNEEQHSRFLPLLKDPSRLQVTGNLKLDLSPQSVDIPFWRKRLQCGTKAIAIASTHGPEELSLLDALWPIQDLFFFLAPRHPERCDAVAEQLNKRGIPFFRWSRLEERSGSEQVLLIDAMGHLPICYALSLLAIVGGSFVPIGGHNILEPSLYGLPVLFGPHMHNQTEFVSRVLKLGAGQQIALDQIRQTVALILQNPPETGVRRLRESLGGALERTLFSLKKENILL